MLDNLFNSIGGEVINSLTEKTGISAEQAKQILPIGQESLQSGLMEQIASGNLGDIIGMLNSSGGSLQDNSLFGQLKGMFMQSIMAKMGLPAGLAGTIAGDGMESILSNITGILGGEGNITEDTLKDGLGLQGGLGNIAGNMLKDKLGDSVGGMLGGLFGK